MLSAFEKARYSRQICLHDIGESGQEKLRHASVLVIGAGGLGCPALLYLAAAGIGRLGIADNDKVALHNLHRQVLYDESDIGKIKTQAARKKLLERNKDIRIVTFDCRIDGNNARDIISEFDLVIDGTDDLFTRYLVNEICADLAKPLVYGAMYRNQGHLSVFHYCKGDEAGFDLRDLFPLGAGIPEVRDCSTAGVMGPLPGMIGTMQAMEAVKIITGAGKVCSGRLVVLDGMSLCMDEYRIEKRPGEERKSVMGMNPAITCTTELIIGPEELAKRLSAGELLSLLDVREPGEHPEAGGETIIRLPLSELVNGRNSLRLQADEYIVFCRSGIRSRKAAELLNKQFPGTEFRSLEGGLDAWLEASGSTEFKIRHEEEK